MEEVHVCVYSTRGTNLQLQRLHRVQIMLLCELRAAVEAMHHFGVPQRRRSRHSALLVALPRGQHGIRARDLGQPSVQGGELRVAVQDVRELCDRKRGLRTLGLEITESRACGHRGVQARTQQLLGGSTELLSVGPTL